jgi:hypothetical protein
MYGQQITVPEQIRHMIPSFRNTSDRFPIQNRIPVTLVLDPQAHFKKNNNNLLTPEFKTRFSLNDFAHGPVTSAVNTFGQSATIGLLDIYQPPGPSYQYTVYDYSLSPPTGTVQTVNANLYATELKIDRIYDVYLESLTTFNCVANTSKDTMGYVLQINDWNIDNHSNLNGVSQAIIIPNECTAPNTTTTHKAKKLNYITRLTPDNITEISGKISTLKGDVIFPQDSEIFNESRLIIELILIPREKN